MPTSSPAPGGPGALGAAGQPPSASLQTATRRSVNSVRVFAILALLIALLAVLASVWVWQRSERIVREAARRWQDAENRVAQVEQQSKLAQDQVRDLVGRSAVLENKLGETVGQQAQLERMYKSMAKDSLDAVLADAENSLSIAAQQLLVGANVPGALVALQDADSVLKRADPASVAGLRRLVSRDSDRLRAVPVADIASMMVRLDSVASAIDQLPMVSGLVMPVTAKPDATADAGVAVSAAASTAASASPVDSPIDRLTSSGLRGWHALKNELQGLIRVNRVDAPEALLLAPSQQYFVRENLRLTLLSARLSLLSRNDPVLHTDLERAIGWLGSYYDKQSKSVANAIATLRQLQANKVATELPSLAESLSAVRALRLAREGNR